MASSSTIPPRVHHLHLELIVSVSDVYVLQMMNDCEVLMGVSLCGTYYSAVMLDFYRIGIISAHTVLFTPKSIALRESVQRIDR